MFKHYYVRKNECHLHEKFETEERVNNMQLHQLIIGSIIYVIHCTERH